MVSSARMQRGALATFAVAIALASGCAGAPAPCDGGCASGERCVVGRCRPDGRPVVPEEARRVVLLARDVVVLSSGDLPTDVGVVPLGAGVAGSTTVLLSFDAAYSPTAELTGAFLVLDPDPASPGPARPVALDVAQVLGAWSSTNASVGRTPSLSPSFASLTLPPTRRAPLRVDVTEIVSRTRGGGHGLALLSRGDDPIGARFIVAAGDSTGPRLELYLK